jgi:hypothetical protein
MSRGWYERWACVVVLLALPGLRADELEPTKTHAVIAGVLEWEAGLQGFPKRNRKDQELRDLLVKRGTPEENIALLLDKEASLANIRDAVATTAKKAGPDSTLIIYYAGHGMPCGSTYCFATYELRPGRIMETGWLLQDLGDTLAQEFKGKRVILCADCCFSGGLHVVVDRLAEAGIAAANLTSAGPSNTSTNNWTFTQSLIDGLNGESLIDANSDGRITLAELDAEVREAMRHIEGQQHGFTSKGIDGVFVLAKSSGSKPKAEVQPKFPIGSYVKATDKGVERVGRIVGTAGDRFTVQFYDYSDKRTVMYAGDELVPSDGTFAPGGQQLDVGMVPDCDVEWGDTWWPAKLLETKNGKYYIHYVGWSNSWDEWVTEDRYRPREGRPQEQPQPGNDNQLEEPDCEVLWGGTWWKAKVLEQKDGKYRIHYVGWDSSWDEWIGPERYRPLPGAKPTPATSTGADCEVKWGDQWYPAKVLEKKGRKFRVRLIGYSDVWEDWVQPKRIRPLKIEAKPVPENPSPPQPVIGDKEQYDCEVLWGGTWWKAKVLEKKDGKLYIHYVGWDSSWDEWITPDRYRPLQRKPESAPQPAE